MMQHAVRRLPRSMRLCSLFVVFGVLAMLGACAGKAEPMAVPAPVLIAPAVCPQAPAPSLPQLDATLLLDDPDNVRALRLRDVVMRGYIAVLRRTVACYERQTQADPERQP